MTKTHRGLALAVSLSMFTLQACVTPPTAGTYSAVFANQRLTNPNNGFTRSLAAKPAAYVGGYVVFGSPVEGATVSLLDPAGKSLGITGKTGKFGIFGIHDQKPPKDFTIVATGGTINGEPFTGELRQDVKAHSQLNQFAHLSVATTLASLYRQNAHQDVDPIVAEADAYRFLGMTFAVEPMQFDRHFDAAAFLRAANAAGGVIAYARTLASDIPDPKKSQRFVSFQTKAYSFMGFTASSVATDLAKGAISSVGGMILGDAMRLIGLGGPSMGQLKSELDAIVGQLQEIHMDMVALQDALQLDTTNSDYQSAMTAITEVTSAIDVAQKSQSRMAAYKADTTLSAADVAKSVEAQQEVFDTALNTINSGGLPFWKTTIMGSGPSAAGLIVKYGRFVTSKSPIWGPKQAQLMDTYFDWIDAYQAGAAQLIVSAKPGATAFLKDTYADLQDNRTAEMAVMRGNLRQSLSLVTPGTTGVPGRDVAFPNYLPDGMICDTVGKALWTAGRLNNPVGFILNMVIGVPANSSWETVQQAKYNPYDWYSAQSELLQNLPGQGWVDPSSDDLLRMFSNRQALANVGWNSASYMDGVTTVSLFQDNMKTMAFQGNYIAHNSFQDVWPVPYVGGTVSKAIMLVKKAPVADPTASYWYP